MNAEQFRSWVYTQVEAWRSASYPTLPTFYENAEEPNQDTVGARWLDVRITFIDTGEVTVGNRPRARDSGTVKLMLYTKAGEGTQIQDQILESLREHFRTNNRSGNSKLNTPRRHSAPPALGWVKAGLIIPFLNDLE